jgi:hypothetical protein
MFYFLDAKFSKQSQFCHLGITKYLFFLDTIVILLDPWVNLFSKIIHFRYVSLNLLSSKMNVSPNIIIKLFEGLGKETKQDFYTKIKKLRYHETAYLLLFFINSYNFCDIL